MIHLKVISFKKKIFSNLVKKIIVTGVEGELGIYPKHIPFLTILKPSTLKIFYKNKIKYIYLIGSILEIRKNKIIILSDIAIQNNNKKKIKYFNNIIQKMNKKNNKLSNNFLKFDKVLKEIYNIE
ncbi:ATP synthase F1 subunit epsilon [Buchnera aphidicola (Mollitrichosiphum nigrofasciatum)]|uniref:ATP synthase F1 subunit epsilon n=1 Tax=Buchnera aphidicola TaxID=9 RepID=UPI0031B816D6